MNFKKYIDTKTLTTVVAALFVWAVIAPFVTGFADKIRGLVPNA